MLSAEEKLRKISFVFNIPDLINLRINERYIQRYYDTNFFAYNLFHNNLGFVHMGVSKENDFKFDDLYNQARLVSGFLKGKDHVLELASGRGANSIFLAKKFPYSNFVATDFTKKHLSKAKKLSKNLNNLTIEFCDYHDLSKFYKKKFDLIFIIEALCHSHDKERVISEVKKILAKDGIFIIIDGFFKDSKKLDRNSKTLTTLIEKGMGVESFESYTKTINDLKKNNFQIIREIDWSKNIMPSLLRFEKSAQFFFSHRYLARLITKIFPTIFSYNIIAGYLMPNVVVEGIASYNAIVCRGA